MTYLRVLLIPLVLTLAIWLVAVGVPAHNQISKFAFQDGFPGDASAWQLRPSDALGEFGDGIKLTSRAANVQRMSYSTEVVGRDGELIEIAALVDIEPSHSSESSIAALAVWFLDASGEWLGYKKVFSAPSRYTRARAQRVVQVPQGGRQLIVGLTSQPGADTLTVQDLTLHVVTKNEHYFVAMTCLITSWSLYLLMIGRWTIQHAGPIFLGALILGGLMLILGIASSAEIMATFVHPLLRSIEPWIGSGWQTWLSMAMKIGHMMGFLIMSICALLVNRRAGGQDTVIVLLMFVFAVATELVQLHVPDRQSSLMDLFIDGAGIIIGWILFQLVQSRKTRSKSAM